MPSSDNLSHCIEGKPGSYNSKNVCIFKVDNQYLTIYVSTFLLSFPPNRNLGLSMSICHTQENMVKNRYRDISPYDATRVVLNECPSGDYINANHVIMTIPGSGIVNR